MLLVIYFSKDVENLVGRIIIERAEVAGVLLLLERHLRYNVSLFPEFPFFCES